MSAEGDEEGNGRTVSGLSADHRFWGVWKGARNIGGVERDYMELGLRQRVHVNEDRR